jgi:DNA-binding Lrp family transcriptional regulator
VAAPLRRAELEMLRMMIDAPKVGVREWARRLGIARGTAQARINRLEECGAIVSYRPQLSNVGLGLPVMAYVHVHVSQGHVDRTVSELERVPELIEADSIAGDADLLCRVVARDNLHLEAVLQRMIDLPGVERTRTEIVLNRRIARRVTAMVDALIRDAE